MKAVLVFDLPQDKEEFETANMASEYKFCLHDVAQIIRSKLKYGDLTDDQRAAVEEINKNIWAAIDDRSLKLLE